MSLNLKYFLVLFISFATTGVFGQTINKPIVDFTNTKIYEIGGIKVTGAKFSDENAIISVSGLKNGEKLRVPGEEIGYALKKLLRLKLFSDVQIFQEKLIGDVIFLEIRITELPRLTRYSFQGVKKSQHEDLQKIVDRFIPKGSIVTENAKSNIKQKMGEFFKEKGYLDAKIDITQTVDDKSPNGTKLLFIIKKDEKVKIQNILFEGNTVLTDRKLRSKMKNTHRKWKLFSSSKLIDEEYETDKNNIIAYYNTLGYKDASITKDSVWRESDGDLLIKITLHEGNKYYFRNIVWKGNTIYNSKILGDVLGIKKGDVYNMELLEQRLKFSQDGRDISSLYMDEGYLFFNIEPTEVAVFKDSIDVDIRVVEGAQATIDKVIIRGNDRTHEHVIRRELRTRPGAKFSRSDIIRSQREIMALNYFNPEKMDINTPVNAQRGTVDIEYTLEEKSSDQLELSAGYNGFNGLIGTLGVSFNNFSLRNIAKKETWNPLPQGDGQKLSLRVQSAGKPYLTTNISFTEPWLGGKKPTSLTVAGFLTRYTNNYDKASILYGSLVVEGGTVGIGTRLKKPDDNFTYYVEFNLQNYLMRNWTNGSFGFNTEAGNLENGSFNNLNIKQTLTRSTIADPIFPKDGSRIALSLQLTPPYSLFNKDVTSPEISLKEKYRWLEYHKWRLDAEWYKSLGAKFVLKAAAKIGILGYYNKKLGITPIEQFKLGGDGLSNRFAQGGITGLDIISMRGYKVEDIYADPNSNSTVFNKYTVELRYPFSLNPSSTIYATLFAQGGNAFNGLKNFNPFDLKRSVGMGLRVFLPMFGTLGFDYGLGFDKNLPEGSRTLKNYGQFNIILGFEPE